MTDALWHATNPRTALVVGAVATTFAAWLVARWWRQAWEFQVTVAGEEA